MTKPQNVDPNEIKKFEEMASRWWDLEGEFKPLHQINPLRLNYVLERADGLFGKKVLDVGCGGGILAESMAREGAQVTGLDMGKEPLEVARLHALETGTKLTYIQSTIEDHAQDNAQAYDVVTCMEMLEHVPDPLSVIQSCAALVKPGGHVFFSTLNRNFKSYLFAIVGAEKLLKIVPEGTHDHEKFIRPSELLKMIDATPLQEQAITGLLYNPLTDTYRLGANVDVNYIIHTRLF
ncbi:bifunctional 2-polyprenyl-6-hydroxyphenol methylase/3-demethylubiquinol 3-O-methyltransferase UbiG [Vibrio fluvialis]|jgi:2-polyprenyl-6-hydroxyphenyl methylase/3-demethylubiquinone-9 3-methyltransferase|uniref:bifunctional 2-polyprenyl-6-hydroxyphenol methylase/3-demethylubiquinol 3-O-methyltransferase UbiG n=1 Tax=Vibrio TaxID=662 RepID=UPI000509E73F|nr:MULTISPECIES: bifunctional 2-polyprenyl-6-hydroxyphenol methylase/3-demethylubiquinol 3-O-methyltransferase UbiG [Vibrio]TNF14375.1 MAG: bifunctional 2-polyprenyl-6-hydroxyphenol methylase/3-demethylubiquinol 3-O-methyltransferase UbiG [Vibrionaceae bacterium]EKO3372467.1 bifunctional 2-polyprenyl-6-hydroxyphenol methylase/3-demethylubiquinol 3-O-methyltransferase UbiG [Vibrio fluvialis]EKO3377406.1 bifunctional 2-polyprenyl-6-hydroxyphenol methylase/3-demethylubiquinol 3-O-methyltransferase 